MVTRRKSVCPHDCPSVCALDVEVLDEKTIGRVYGLKSHSYTAGVICAKVSRYAERVHHPERILNPLILAGEKGSDRNAYRQASWDEAMMLVASKFKAITEQYGAEAIWPYHYAGTMGLVQRDGLDRFRSSFGTSRQHSTFCTTLADAGWIAGTGAKRGSDSRQIQHTDLLVVWGGNPVSTQVNVINHYAQAKRKRNAKLVVIDPYKTKTADKADLHLCLRPGTDAALACAVIHVLLKERYADREYLAQYTDFSATTESHFEARTPAWAANITGLSEQEIIDFARLYGAHKKSFIRMGYGFSRSRNGAVNMHAASCLPAITGAWREPGGGALYSNGHLYPVDKSLICGTQQAQTRLFDQSRIGPILCGHKPDLQDGPEVHALFVQNTNPAVVAPDTNKVLQGLARTNLFTVVHEQFFTETAAFADVILPATQFLEHDDVYVAGGHTYVQFGPKLIETPGECRSNHRVVSELCERLGLSSSVNSMSERELIDETLSLSGLPDSQALENDGGFDCARDQADSNFLKGFDTPDKLFHFAPDWSAIGPHTDGLPALPDHWDVIDKATPKHPLRLVAAPARQFLNTSFTETPSSRRMEKRPQALIHPADMAQYRLNDGELVELANDLGVVTLHAAAFDGVQQGTVVVESLWPNADFPGGIGINALVSAEPGKPNGGAVFHDTAVRVSPAP